MSKYKGSCHCGQVQFEVEIELSRVVTCNCSICVRKGAVYTAVPESRFNLIQGEDELTLYQFGTGTAKHYFCKQCGIHPFHRSRMNPEHWTINVNCLEQVDRDALEPKMFDGQNWEETAEQWRSRRK